MKSLYFLLFALLLNFIPGYPAQADMTAQQLTIWQQQQQDLLKSKFKDWTTGITQQLLEQISKFEHDTTNSDCSESTLGLETLLDKLKKDFDQLHGNQHLNLDSQFSKFERLKSRFEFLKSESGSEGASRCLDRFRFYHNQFTPRIVTKEQNFARLFRDRVVDSLIRNMKARNLAEVGATLRQGTYENTVLLEQVADKLLRTESYYMQDNFEYIRWTVWNLAKQSPEHAVILTNAVLKKLEELNYLESSYTLKLAHTVHHTSNRMRKFPIQIQNLFSKDVLCIKNFGSSAFIHESEPLIKPAFTEDTSTSAVDVFPTTTFAPPSRSLSTSQSYKYTSSYENRSTASQDFTHTFQSPKTSQNFAPSYNNRSTQSQDSFGSPSTPARSLIESSRNTQPHQYPSSTTQSITPSNRYTSTTARTTTQWYQNPNAMLPNYPTSLKYAGTPRFQRSTIRTVNIEIKMKRNQKYTDGLNVTEDECGWVTQSMRGDNYNDPVVFRFHRTVNDPERNWTLASQADRVMLTSDGAYNINLDWEVSVVKTYSHQYGYGLGFKFRPSPASNSFSKFICHGRQHSSRYSYEAPLLLSRGPEYASSENANACTWTLTPCKDVRP